MPEICAWIIEAWKKIKDSTIVNGFKKARIFYTGNRDEMEPSTSAADDAETEPSTSTEADDGSGEEADACADELPEEFSVLFVLDSEESDFSGFSTSDLEETA